MSLEQGSAQDRVIPWQVAGLKFIRVKKREKRALEKRWNIKWYNLAQILKTFNREPYMENYGILTSEVRVLDDDTPDKRLIKMFNENFGYTFRVRDHLYFHFDDGDKKKIIMYDVGEDGKKIHLGEVQGAGQYVVGPGSVHPSGEVYKVTVDRPIITISKKKFEEVFGKYYIKKEKKIEFDLKQKSSYDGDKVEDIPLTSIINTSGLQKTPEGYQGPNPWHGSETGMNFTLNQSKNVWHCFRCFPIDTKVYTPDGVRNIQDIKVGNKVFGEKNNSQRVKNVIISEVDTEFYEFETFTPVVKMTGDHPILLAKFEKGKENPLFSWMTAREVFTTLVETDDDYFFVYPTRHESTLSEIEGVKLDEYFGEKLAEYFKGINHKEKNPKKIKTATKILGNLVKKSLRHDKDLSFGKMINAPLTFLKNFVEVYTGLFESKIDLFFGNLKKDDIKLIRSSSENFIMEIQTVLFRLGFIPKYYNVSPLEGVGGAYLRWNIDSDETIARKDKDYIYIPIKSITKTKEKMKVYNLETEDGTYQVPFIVHNCSTGGGPAEAIAINEGIISCDQSTGHALKTEDARRVIEIAREKYGLKKPEKKDGNDSWMSEEYKKSVEEYMSKRSVKLSDEDFEKIPSHTVKLTDEQLKEYFGETRYNIMFGKEEKKKKNKKKSIYKLFEKVPPKKGNFSKVSNILSWKICVQYLNGGRFGSEVFDLTLDEKDPKNVFDIEKINFNLNLFFKSLIRIIHKCFNPKPYYFKDYVGLENITQADKKNLKMCSFFFPIDNGVISLPLFDFYDEYKTSKYYGYHIKKEVVDFKENYIEMLRSIINQINSMDDEKLRRLKELFSGKYFLTIMEAMFFTPFLIDNKLKEEYKKIIGEDKIPLSSKIPLKVAEELKVMLLGEK